MRRVSVSVAVLSLLLTGCASSSKSIQPAYVSATPYETLDCGQLKVEAARISIEASAAAKKQDKIRTKDAVVTTVGVVIFWPTLFLIDGNGPKAAEVARLKGEMKAIEVAANSKNCAITFDRGEEMAAQTASAAPVRRAKD